MNKKGFTLIELLGVIVVLGIVSTIVIVYQSGLKKDVNVKYEDTSESLIIIATKAYFDHNHNKLPKNKNDGVSIKLEELIKEDYIKKSKNKISLNYDKSIIIVTKVDTSKYNYVPKLVFIK
ncbi:MAG: prepilin-type N-terminal cleavage/methylation domain-containing protein [Bacilli bacterium]